LSKLLQISEAKLSFISCLDIRCYVAGLRHVCEPSLGAFEESRSTVYLFCLRFLSGGLARKYSRSWVILLEPFGPSSFSRLRLLCRDDLIREVMSKILDFFDKICYFIFLSFAAFLA